MDWQRYYQDNCLDIKEILAKIKSGNRVVFGHAIGEPSALISTLVKNKEKYRNSPHGMYG